MEKKHHLLRRRRHPRRRRPPGIHPRFRCPRHPFRPGKGTPLLPLHRIDIRIVYPFILDVGFDGVIGAGGSYVQIGEQMLYHHVIDGESLRLLREYFDSHGFDYYLESNDGLFGSENLIPRLEHMLYGDWEHDPAPADGKRRAATSSTRSGPSPIPPSPITKPPSSKTPISPGRRLNGSSGTPSRSSATPSPPSGRTRAN